MAALWIVHRDPALRAALARLAAAPAETPAGAPGARAFDEARSPDAILMGLTGDLESELEFAHRTAPRLRGARWILLGEANELERARGLFDSLPAVFFSYPPDPTVLRAALRTAARRPEAEPLPLSQRPARDALSERFARAFADLDLPELLHAFDPRLGQLPLLALGEPGTGRGTLVRYVHQFGPTLGGTLVDLDCTPATRAEDLLERIALARRHDRIGHATALWLHDAHRLSPALQHEVAGWIEYGLPWGTPRTRLLRWLGAAEAAGLELPLRRALGGLSVTIPPLRQRPELLANLASATATAWCTARGLHPRRLGEDALAVIEEYPWPGNLRELEAVIGQSLASSAADPLPAGQLVLDGVAFVPIEAASVATLLDEDASREEDLPWPEEGGAISIATEDGEIDDALQQLVAEPFPEETGPQIEILELPPEPYQAPKPPGEAERSHDPQAGGAGAQRGEAERSHDSSNMERSLQRLAAAVGHEVRNPLTAVRTFAELLPERFDDADFRAHFARLAVESIGRVEDVLARLEQLAAFPTPERRAVDVGALLQEVLEKRRGTIHERRLVVLEELDRSHPTALCDAEQLRFAFEAILDKSLELVPERGDVYLASRRHDSGLRGEPSVRILLRYRGYAPQAGEAGAQRGAAKQSHDPQAGAQRGAAERSHDSWTTDVSPAANALAFAAADLVIRAQGGTLALDTSDRNETVLVIDLPS